MGIGFCGCAQRLDEFDERIEDVRARMALLESKNGMPIGSDRELLESQKLADVRSQVATMRNDITVLNGRVESLEFENKNLVSRMNELQEEAAKHSKDAAQLHETVVSASQSSDVEGDYNLALRAHQDGNFEKAEKLFDSFLIKYPKHSLSDRALFWMGEGYMARKQYKKAISKFQDLIDSFSKSSKRCEARDRQIAAFTQLGMTKEAGDFSEARSAECPKK